MRHLRAEGWMRVVIPRNDIDADPPFFPQSLFTLSWKMGGWHLKTQTDFP